MLFAKFLKNKKLLIMSSVIYLNFKILYYKIMHNKYIYVYQIVNNILLV